MHNGVVDNRHQTETSGKMSISCFGLIPFYNCRKFIQGEFKVDGIDGKSRALKSFVDWKNDCSNGEHLWIYVGNTSEPCYVGDNECFKTGPPLSCSACKISAHTGCIEILTDKIKFLCRQTYKDLTVGNPRQLKEIQQHNITYHHWVHKRNHCGRCKQCTKTFTSTKLPFSSKEIQAVTCSWCKVSYHNKENCYSLSALTEQCTFGVHRESIIPPTWIVKLPKSLRTNKQTEKFDETYENNNSQYDEYPGQQAPVIRIDSEIGRDTTGSEALYGSLESGITGRSLPKLASLPSSGNDPVTLSDYVANSCDIDEFMLSASQSVDNNKSHTNSTLSMNDNNNELDYRTEAEYSNDNIPNTQTLESYSCGDMASRAHDSCSTIQTSNNEFQTNHNPNYENFPCENIKQYNISQCKSISPQNNALGVTNINYQSEDTGYEDMSSDLNENDVRRIKTSKCSSKYGNDYCQSFKLCPHPVPGVPDAGTKPVLVFINPRSGGNQGTKMMQKFTWLLNPRQVCDLIQQGGPKYALSVFKDLENLTILTIGGDGTASWILSSLDELGIPNRIPVAVLPLGTGNDLARTLNWGGYTDEPVAKILSQVRQGEIVQLDRWNIHVERNYDIGPPSPNESSSGSISIEVDQSALLSKSPSQNTSLFQNTNQNDLTGCDNNSSIGFGSSRTISQNIKSNNLSDGIEDGTARLPMDVINNYFSFGVDAHIALEFHTAREAHPKRFSSRLRNKMFYGQAGGKDLLQRKWKDLSNYVTLYCDGQDMTPRLKELKVHSVLFLNISSYGGGTRPWSTANTMFSKPKTDDELIEVIGLTTYQLPLLQAGGHGTCIAQCRRAKIVTSRTIPMQVDGEPCKLLPSIITISFRNRVCMLAKSKSS